MALGISPYRTGPLESSHVIWFQIPTMCFRHWNLFLIEFMFKCQNNFIEIYLCLIFLISSLSGGGGGGVMQLVLDTMRLTAEFAKIGSAYPITHLVLTRTKCIWVITSWGQPFSGFQNKFSFILRVSSTYPNLPRHSLLYYNVHYLVPDKYRQTYRHT